MTLRVDASYERLREERERLGISLEELASTLDVPVTRARRWEERGYGQNYIPSAIMHVFKYWNAYAPYALSGKGQRRTPGSWVSWVLFSNNLTSAELARMMDVTPGAVANWKKAEAIPIVTEYAIRYILSEKGMTA